MMSPATFGVGFVLCALSNLVVAFQQGGNVHETASIHVFSSPSAQVDNDVQLSLPGSLQLALTTIENVKTMPSCAKMASSALLNKCSSFDSSIQHDSSLKRGTDLFVEEEADIYAARLAVCELSRADFAIPKDCRSFVPTEKMQKKRGIRAFWHKNGSTEPTELFQFYEDITENNLQQCRKALGSTPQSWTSFSNNRQNAVSMCHAMQSEIDKEDQLHVAKILAQTATASTESFKDVVEQVAEMKSKFSELASAMPQFQRDLATGNSEQLEFVNSFWREVERIQMNLANVAQGFTGVADQIRETKDDVADIRKAAKDSASETTQLARWHQQDLKDMSTAVINVNEYVEYMREIIQQEVIQEFYNIVGNIDVVNGFMPKLMQNLTDTDEAHSNRWQKAIEQHEEYQATQKETLDLLEKSKSAAEHTAEIISFIMSLLNVKKWAKFVSFVCVYGLMSYGAWLRCAGYLVVPAWLAALGTGLLLSSISTFLFGPFDLCRALMSRTATIAMESDVIFGVVLGSLGCFGVVITSLIVIYAFRGKKKACNYSSEYDPASPSFEPKSKWIV